MPDKKKKLEVCPLFRAALLAAGTIPSEMKGDDVCLGEKCEGWSKFNETCGLKLQK